MRHKSYLFIATLIVLALLAGCTHIALPAMFPPGAENINVHEVSVAVDGSGTKHIFTSERLEGESDPYQVVYIRSKVGEDAGSAAYSYLGGISSNPDVAASFNGRAYLVWRQYEGTGYYKNRWAYLDPGDETMQGIAYLETGTESMRPPKVAGPVVNSASDRVYAVYEVRESLGTALRYRELSNSTNTGWVSMHPGNAYVRRNQSVAVGADGTLHVAWIEDTGTQLNIYYNNNFGKPTGDLTPDDPVFLGQDVSLPAAAGGYVAGSPGTVYGFVAFFVFSPVAHPDSDSLFVQLFACSDPASCPDYAPGDMNLDTALHWTLVGKPVAVAYGDTVYIAFAADNDNTTGSATEIFLMTYDRGAGTKILEQITDNGGQNTQPVITLTTNIANMLPVIAWFHDDGGGSYQVQMYDAYHDQINILEMDANAGSFVTGLDLANGNYLNVAGVWTAPKPPKVPKAVSLQQVLWMSYNDYANFLPLMSNP
jgi:hypothetical protein